MTKEEYYKNPMLCRECNIIIKFRKGNRNREVKNPFCDIKCKSKWYSKKTEAEYYANPFYCKRCGDTIPYIKRKRFRKKIAMYCGNSCSVKSTNELRFTEEVRQRIGSKHKLIQKELWTPEFRKKHSELMQLIRDKYPESYSSKNVCGRVKSIEIADSYGKQTKCMGTWELLVSEFLNVNNIKWTNKIEKLFTYAWNGKLHRYFPDFYLPEKNVYIEVKGFERERDQAKWSQFPEKLIIIRKNEISQIRNGTYKMEK